MTTKPKKPAYALRLDNSSTAPYERGKGAYRHLQADLCIIEDGKPRNLPFDMRLTAQAGGFDVDNPTCTTFYGFHTKVGCDDACERGHIGGWFCHPYDEMHRLIKIWRAHRGKDWYVSENTFADFVSHFMESTGVKQVIYTDDKRVSFYHEHKWHVLTGVIAMKKLIDMEAKALNELYPPQQAQASNE